MPLTPLFSPVYTSTRPYSQTKSNTQRALMLPDEIMRMDNKECLVLLRGQKPLRLYKIIPDEHPSFERLRDVRVSDYTPRWRQEEERPKPAAVPPPPPPADPVPPPATPEVQEPEQAPQTGIVDSRTPQYDYVLLDPELDGFPDLEPDQSARYGALDLIEALPQDVGGEHNEGQR